MIDVDKTRELLNRAKGYIKNETLVSVEAGLYVPVAIILRYIRGEWMYSIELRDRNRINSSITVTLESVNWSGGEPSCKE